MLAGLFVGRPARRGRAVMPGSEDAGQSLNRQRLRCRDGSQCWSHAVDRRSTSNLKSRITWAASCRCKWQHHDHLWRGRPGHRTRL